MDLELKGRGVIVTGGSRGIGRAIADVLAAEGANVALAARDPARLRQAAREIEEPHGVRAVPISYDIRDAASVDRMTAEAADALGRVDALINNGAPSGGAGTSATGLTDDYLLENLNAKAVGYLRCVRAVLPLMRKQGYGRIVNVAGMAARHAGAIPGGMRNAAVAVMGKAVSLGEGRRGIAVTTIHPGGTHTGRADILRWQGPGPRRVGARDVAYVAAFLASPRAALLTGETLSVSAGGRV